MSEFEIVYRCIPDEQSSQFYQELYKDAFYVKKSGFFEKGDAKLSKDFIDLTGIKNFKNIKDPNVMLDIMRRNQ